jgi:hypothetical protein
MTFRFHRSFSKTSVFESDSGVAFFLIFATSDSVGAEGGARCWAASGSGIRRRAKGIRERGGVSEMKPWRSGSAKLSFSPCAAT